MTPDSVSRARTVRVWDPLVRVLHWGLVVAFIAAFATGDEWERAHEVIGYSVAGLIAVRIVWGVYGPRPARFADFVRGPTAVASYLVAMARGRAPRFLGHNPAGGAMIVAMLALLVTISLSGIMLTTATFWEVEWVEELHEASVNAMLALVVLHVAGVVVASFEHGENLVKAMITGRKRA